MISKKKTKELEQLLGEHVYVFFKTTAVAEEIDPNNPVVGTGIRGYVIDVSTNFLYLGGTPEQYDVIVAIDEIGVIRLVPEVDGTIHIVHPENGNAH